ncbi:tRNA-uridine aminocarboxypropyltransferase [Permianibacter aggregans]|uniref:tRNA-uridine aminocarboxypropyltransferase n=1 Tax=Permianibacter aggregans TaxID=1510150 RepID=A0A4R6UUA4_9GAMM|nr:tRNA-uridine aminocarboxypropyltransferase [Permianibacter aggregans]TDQ49479.1 DTW domain-containing protein YfiP [Permianibacter aggregans]
MSLTCPQCQKVPELCLCDQITPHDTRLHVAILQHPQEPDKHLGSAMLAHLQLSNSSLKVGLSVANLKSVTGFDINPKEWAVLFLGSQYKFREIQQRQDESEIYFFNNKDEEAQVPLEQIKGIVVLDGTWAQAKTLWWRNPWLLKCWRIVIRPRQHSLYGKLRKEPRSECLSTIESIAYTLEIFGEPQQVSDDLLASFRRLLQRYRDGVKHGTITPIGKPGPSPRRRSNKPKSS